MKSTSSQTQIEKIWPPMTFKWPFPSVLTVDRLVRERVLSKQNQLLSKHKHKRYCLQWHFNDTFKYFDSLTCHEGKSFDIYCALEVFFCSMFWVFKCFLWWLCLPSKLTDIYIYIHIYRYEYVLKNSYVLLQT